MPDFLADVLTWDNNYHYALAVQTAVDMGLPPTMFILKDKQPGAWTDEDKKLALAWTILNKESCPKCGQPLWICRSTDQNVAFKVRKGLCYASKEKEAWDKKNEKKLKPGEFGYIIAYTYDGGQMPKRKDWLESLAEE